MNLLRVALADANTLLREGLKRVFAEHKDFAVVGEAANDAEAYRIVKTTKPDVLLVDLNFPQRGASSLILKLRRERTKTKFLVLSLFPETRKLLKSAKAGACGCILKQASPEYLFRAVRSVCHNEIAVDKQIRCAHHFAKLVRQVHPNVAPDSANDKVGNLLTKREYEILSLVANGDTNQTISSKLGITIQTVKVHLNHILTKLEVHNRTQAALRYLQHLQTERSEPLGNSGHRKYIRASRLN